MVRAVSHSQGSSGDTERKAGPCSLYPQGFPTLQSPAERTQGTNTTARQFSGRVPLHQHVGLSPTVSPPPDPAPSQTANPGMLGLFSSVFPCIKGSQGILQVGVTRTWLSLKSRAQRTALPSPPPAGLRRNGSVRPSLWGQGLQVHGQTLGGAARQPA